jgi:hypothetical protein
MYFVSIENTPYHHWQIELLIESFRLHGLEERLFVAIADSPSNSSPKNLTSHKLCALHANYGSLNKITSLISSLESGKLKQPFVLLHPDMVLYKPIPMEHPENIVFHTAEPDEALKASLEDKIHPILEGKGLSRDFLPWLPVGATMYFKDVPLDFFKRVHGWMYFFKNEKAAWILSMYEHLGMLSMAGRQFESNLWHTNVDLPIIHYSGGFPPFFHKGAYKNPDWVLTEVKDPHDALKLSLTTNTEYVDKVINSYRKN